MELVIGVCELISVFLYLCGLVVRVPGYRSKCPWFDSWHYKTSFEAVGLDRDPLNLVSVRSYLEEELAALVQET
jgi:hypothetical protein